MLLRFDPNFFLRGFLWNERKKEQRMKKDAQVVESKTTKSVIITCMHNFLISP
jgi:hypothetical protein